jgi:hypothetical protein
MASYQMKRQEVYYVVPHYMASHSLSFTQCYDNFRSRTGLDRVIFVLNWTPCHEHLGNNGGIATRVLKFSASLRRMDRFTLWKLCYLIEAISLCTRM